MKRKLLCIIIMLAMLCTGIITTPALAEDMNISGQPSAWAKDSVNAAIDEGFVPQGLQSNYTQPLTRAEFCALIVAFYETVTGGKISGLVGFDDTADINVEKAAPIGVALGTGDNKFNPGANLNRQQAAVMLSRLADAIEKPLPDAYVYEIFSNYDEIAQWAWSAVGGVYIAGIMQGVGGGAFAPLNPCTREQCIVAIMRLYKDYDVLYKDEYLTKH